jgi:hypothetical protein
MLNDDVVSYFCNLFRSNMFLTQQMMTQYEDSLVRRLLFSSVNFVIP